MLTDPLPIVCDLLAITAVAGTYFRRHQRRDLLFAYLTLNIGVFSVTAMLASASVSVGLALGLFGVLSMIRLRSDPITQDEIAYYFVALALGLVAGVAGEPRYLAPILMALLVMVTYVADHPRLVPRARRQLLRLDAAIPDEAVLREHIERRLGIDVRHLIVQELDFVRDLTVVDVRYRVPTRPRLVSSEDHPVAGLNLPEPVVHQATPVRLPVPAFIQNQNGHHPHREPPAPASPTGTR